MCSSLKDSTPIPLALQSWGRSFRNMNHQVDKPHLKHSSLGVYALFIHTATTSFLGSESVRSTKLNEAAYLSHGKDGSQSTVFSKYSIKCASLNSILLSKAPLRCFITQSTNSIFHEAALSVCGGYRYRLSSHRLQALDYFSIATITTTTKATDRRGLFGLMVPEG